MVSEKPATATDIATLRTEIAILSEAMREMVGTLETQASILNALLQAVTAPEEGEGRLAEALMRLEIDGIELIDSAPRKGAEGPVAFLHPRSCHGVLVELIEAPGGPSWESLGF